MLRYNNYSAFLKERFGEPVYRVPLNAGLSCPNRDGVKSQGGCVFCDNRSFSPVTGSLLAPREQLTASIERQKKRFSLFIAYLQPFSNTYAPISRLREIYESLISVSGVVGLSIGTRPDCIEPAMYDYLGDLVKRTWLTVEIGLQSSHNETLSLINRGHTYEEFVAAAGRLSKLGIETVAHVILGLPGETREMMLQTAERLAGLPVQGIKIHQLMIVQGTRLEQWYREGRVGVIELADYAPLVSAFLARLRPDQHIHRLMSNATKENGLIAPLWSADKNRVLACVRDYLDANNVMQGSLWRDRTAGNG